jgi:hypothetical protein
VEQIEERGQVTVRAGERKLYRTLFDAMAERGDRILTERECR